MRANLAALCLAAFAGAGVCYGQAAPAVTTLQPGYTTVYCSGFVKDTRLPNDLYVISGEQSAYKIIFSQGENVYINRGSNNGVRVGDRFMVMRETQDPAATEWFKGQRKISNALGILYADVGQLRVVSVLEKTSIAQVEVFSSTLTTRSCPTSAYKMPKAFEILRCPLNHSVAAGSWVSRITIKRSPTLTPLLLPRLI